MGGAELVSGKPIYARGSQKPEPHDWRKADDYSYTKSLNLHEWAWEFVRRNPHYQSLWQRVTDLQEWFKVQPERDLDDFNKRAEPLSTELHDKFFMQSMFDPSKNSLEVETIPFSAMVDVAPTFFLGTSPAPHHETQPWPGYPRYVDIRFDLLVPAGIQAEECKRIIVEKQKELLKRKLIEAIPTSPRKKPSTTHFVTYLRLLDARSQGASFRLMGKVLFASAGDQRNSAKSMLRAAVAMSETGFRDLLQYPAYQDSPGEPASR